MKVGGVAMRPIRALPARDGVEVIDQRALPHRLLSARLDSPQAVFTAIREMWVRGAPLIGASAAYGIALQMNRNTSERALEDGAELLRQARPTAVNLAWAIERLLRVLRPLAPLSRRDAAWAEADAIAEEDVAVNHAIGEHGLALPLSTLDRGMRDGLAEMPIEERNAREVTHVAGRNAAGELVEVSIAPAGTPAANPAFDVTPARLVSALITERGVIAADEEAIRHV